MARDLLLYLMCKSTIILTKITKINSQITVYDEGMLYLQDELKHAVKEMIEKFGTQRYIANLGHGVNKDVDPESVRTFIDAVHMYSEEMNALQ